MRRATLSTLPALLGLLLAAASAQAQSLPPSLTTYFGQDTEGAPYTSVPPNGNAAAARAAFDGSIRLESVGLQSFEATTYGSQTVTVNQTRFETLSVEFVGSGNSPTTKQAVTSTFQGVPGQNQYAIRNDGRASTFATDGTQYLGSELSSIDVVFDTPVSAFGFYGTDFGEAGTTNITLTLTDTDDNTYSFTQDLVINKNGNVLFTGFSDQDKLYKAVAISADNDTEVFGFDSFVIADVNQVTGLEYASGANDPTTEEVIEGQTVRLLLRLDEGAFPNGGTVDVALLPGAPTTGDASDLDGYQTQTVTIAPGDNIVAVPIRVSADGVTDDGEVFQFVLQNGADGFAGRNGETFTLTVGDPLPIFSQSFAPVPAAEDQPTTYTFTVDNTGNGRAASGLSFSTTLPNGLVADPASTTSSCAGTTNVSGQGVSFSGGAVSPSGTCTVSVDVTPTRGGSYTLPSVFLDTDRGATQAAGTTLTAVRGVSLSANATDAAEGGVVRLTATLTSPAPAGGASVEVALAATGTTGQADDLSAGGASPYAAQTLTFAQGATTASVDVTVVVDGQTEGAESFRFALQNAQGAALADPSTVDLDVAASGPRASFVATGGADPAQADNGATISVDAVEGDQVTLTVRLSDGAAGGESVDVVLVTGNPTTGQAADIGDYTTQTVTFDAGETEKTVTVTVSTDGTAEPEELVRLALQNAQGGLTLGGAEAFDLTIAESFAGASFAAATASAEEGDTVTIALELSAPAEGGETVDVVLASGDAADLGGYQTQTVTFAAGDESAEVTVPVTLDGRAEPEETFRFTLSGLVDPNGQQTLDLTVAESIAGASFTAASADAVEGDGVTITVRLTSPAQGGEAVDVVLASGDAADLGDYVTQTITFAADETERSITVPVTADRQAEPAEAFQFTLDGVTDPDGQQTFDLDVARSFATAAFAQATRSAREGDEVAITVVLTGPARGGEAVDVVLAEGDPADLDGFTSQTVTFAEGETEKTVTVAVTEDGEAEADEEEAFQFALQNATDLDLGDPATLALDVGQTGALLSFDLVQDAVGEGAGAYALALSLTEALESPATVTLSLASGDPADLGGFTTRTVEIPAGATSVTVEVPVTDDRAREGDESFAFVLSDPEGNEPDGIALDRSTFSLTVVDNDGAVGGGGGGGGTTPPTAVTTPPRDADGDGVEDGGRRYFAVPVGGLTAGDVARAAAGDGPAPTVYVFDPATGALVAADPDDALDAGQPVYVDVAPGADLSFTGDAPRRATPFYGAPAQGTAAGGRVQVAVGNPGGTPVRLSDLRVDGGRLADVVLVLDPATGAFEPVSLSSLDEDADVLAGYGTVIVQVIPDGDPADVAVTLDLDRADDGLDAAASGLAGGLCPRSSADEVAVCLTLGVGGNAPDERDRAVVRLRPAAAGLRGQGEELDGFDGLDVASVDSTQLALPGGVDGSARLAALSTPFAADTTLTVPLAVTVDGPGLYTLGLARAVEAFRGQDLEVVLVDGAGDVVLAPSEPYTFTVAPGEDLAGRFTLRIGRRRGVDAGAGPGLADAVGAPFPNPSVGRAALEVSVSEPQTVRVTVYDALGRRVAVAFDGEVQAGAPETVTVDGSRLAPGVYVVRVDGATVHEARRLTVAR